VRRLPFDHHCHHTLDLRAVLRKLKRTKKAACATAFKNMLLLGRCPKLHLNMLLLGRCPKPHLGNFLQKVT